MKLPFQINKLGRLRDKWKPGMPLGWTVRERIGIAIVNPRGCAAGSKSVIVGM